MTEAEGAGAEWETADVRYPQPSPLESWWRRVMSCGPNPKAKGPAPEKQSSTSEGDPDTDAAE
ncbi:hypothetical protein ABEU20_000985 [Rhodococcus sp. PAM 2766]|uniref:Uncharacterized protein n=1 Tax=Rhodococcus parequi TaxID=3137122 RepID=A0ABW9FA68_9NOCA